MTTDAERPGEGDPRAAGSEAHLNPDAAIVPPGGTCRSGFSYAVDIYRSERWVALPIPAGMKGPPPEGRTGAAGVDPEDRDYAIWKGGYVGGNLAIRFADGFLGIDVDSYGLKKGDLNLEQFAVDHDLPALPPTISTSSRGTGPSGIYIYRYAPLLMKGRAFSASVCKDVDLIHRGYRYAMAWPSVHPDTKETYRWRRPDGSLMDEGVVPPLSDAALLPVEWVRAISCEVAGGPASGRSTGSAAPRLSKAETEAWLVDQPGDGFPYVRLMDDHVGRLYERVAAGSHRREAMRDGLGLLVRDIVSGRIPGTAIYDFERDCQYIYELPPPGRERKSFDPGKRTDFWNSAAGALVKLLPGGEWRESVEFEMEARKGAAYFAEHPPRLADVDPEGEFGKGGLDSRLPDSASVGLDTWRSFRSSRSSPHAGPVGELPAPDDERGDSWQPRDLRPALEGARDRLRPTILRRTDGVGLLYPARVNGIHADSGVGKGWLVLHAGAQHLAEGGHVAWFDFEDPNEDLLIDRLRLLGVGDEVIINQVHYINPDEPADASVVQRLVEALDPFGPCLVVVDSTGEALGLQGADENKDLDVDGWARLLPKALERAGHTVCLVDHSTKANDNPLHPSGSKRKRAMVSGASWFVELVTPFSEGHPGTLRLKCAKDRHGSFRRGQVGALAHLDGSDTAMTITLEPHGSTAGAAVTPPKKVIDLVVLVVSIVREAGPDGLSLSKLRAEVRLKEPASNQAITDASEHADSLGCISITRGGVGTRTEHHWVRDLRPGDLERLSE